MTRLQIRAYKGTEPFAFVCYAHGDEGQVFQEIQRLNGAGFRLYYDEGIHPGRAWHDELADAIERCALFLIFVTDRAVASRNCQRELSFALSRDKPVLAVHLETLKLPPGIDLALGDRQAILRSHFPRVEYERRFDAALDGYLSRDPERTRRSDASKTEKASGRMTRARLVTIGLAATILLAAGTAAWMWQRAAEGNAAQRMLHASFFESVAADDSISAFLAGRQLEARYRNSEEFSEAWKKITRPISIAVERTDAVLHFRPYLNPTDQDWILLGKTPLEPKDLPNGVIELRVEKSGHTTGRFAVHVPGPVATPTDTGGWDPERVLLPLPVSGELPDGLVKVPATDMPIFVARWTRDVSGDNRIALPAFAVARYEVTNQEFQAFVDAGGYRNESYWAGLAFEVDGKPITFDEAGALMVDTTGRAAPAGWSLGQFPRGEADLPVTGISWYEAVAYARFRGMTLPTLHHWARYATGPWEGEAHLSPTISAASNFDHEGARPAGEALGLGPWGTYNTGGNVREWVWNRAADGHLAMGGSWRDYGTDMASALPIPPMSRNAFVGMRLMQLLGEHDIDGELLAAVDLIPAKLSERAPISDEAFEVLRYQYTATNRPQSSVTVEELESSDTWTLEVHNLTYADGGRLRLFMMKPKRRLPVYQAVIYAPHGGAFMPGRNQSHVRGIFGYAEKVVRTGRIVLMPEWSGSLSRFEPWPPEAETDKIVEFARRQRREWLQDSVDAFNYLDSLDYVDPHRVGYFSESFGSSVYGAFLLALQPRYKTAIWLSSGIILRDLHPTIDPVNFAPRVRQPVLMINGQFDPVFPHEQSQIPLFELLGTPAGEKKHVVYPDGHFRYPENQLAREIADWLDTYLGPVR